MFGLGSEIAGVAVTRSIAKWFKGRGMAFAMGLQLAIARLGTATAFLLSPALIQQKEVAAAAGAASSLASPAVYTLAETARPAFFGMMLLLVGAIFWAVFVAMDARYDRVRRGIASERRATRQIGTEPDPVPHGDGIGGRASGKAHPAAEHGREHIPGRKNRQQVVAAGILHYGCSTFRHIPRAASSARERMCALRPSLPMRLSSVQCMR